MFIIIDLNGPTLVSPFTHWFLSLLTPFTEQTQLDNV